jgi:hypothetical protein
MASSCAGCALGLEQVVLGIERFGDSGIGLRLTGRGIARSPGHLMTFHASHSSRSASRSVSSAALRAGRSSPARHGPETQCGPPNRESAEEGAARLRADLNASGEEAVGRAARTLRCSTLSKCPWPTRDKVATPRTGQNAEVYSRAFSRACSSPCAEKAVPRTRSRHGCSLAHRRPRADAAKLA